MATRSSFENAREENLRNLVNFLRFVVEGRGSPPLIYPARLVRLNLTNSLSSAFPTFASFLAEGYGRGASAKFD